MHFHAQDPAMDSNLKFRAKGKIRAINSELFGLYNNGFLTVLVADIYVPCYH